MEIRYAKRAAARDKKTILVAFIFSFSAVSATYVDSKTGQNPPVQALVQAAMTATTMDTGAGYDSHDDLLTLGCPSTFTDTTPSARVSFTETVTEGGVTQVIQFDIRECSCANTPTPDCTFLGNTHTGVIAAFGARVISQDGVSCSVDAAGVRTCEDLPVAVTKMSSEYDTYLSNRKATCNTYVTAAAERMAAKALKSQTLLMMQEETGTGQPEQKQPSHELSRAQSPTLLGANQGSAGPTWCSSGDARSSVGCTLADKWDTSAQISTVDELADGSSRAMLESLLKVHFRAVDIGGDNKTPLFMSVANNDIGGSSNLDVRLKWDSAALAPGGNCRPCLLPSNQEIPAFAHMLRVAPTFGELPDCGSRSGTKVNDVKETGVLCALLQVTSGDGTNDTPLVLGWGDVSGAGWTTSSGVQPDPDDTVQATNENWSKLGYAMMRLPAFNPGGVPISGTERNYMIQKIMDLKGVIDTELKDADAIIRGAVGAMRFQIAVDKVRGPTQSPTRTPTQTPTRTPTRRPTFLPTVHIPCNGNPQCCYMRYSRPPPCD